MSLLIMYCVSMTLDVFQPRPRLLRLRGSFKVFILGYHEHRDYKSLQLTIEVYTSIFMEILNFIVDFLGIFKFPQVSFILSQKLAELSLGKEIESR